MRSQLHDNEVTVYWEIHVWQNISKFCKIADFSVKFLNVSVSCHTVKHDREMALFTYIKPVEKQ